MSIPGAPQTNLIILCCHAIYIPTSFHLPLSSTLTPSAWLLAPFQTGEEPTFTEHLRTALSLLTTTPSSLLVISGSKTRPEIDLSEAQSYLSLAEENSFFDLFPSSSIDGFKDRILLEEKALDSYGNLVFGMVDFWRKTGKWPEKVTIVSHAFKRERFLDVHCKSLEIENEIFEFVGVDPGYMVEGSGEFDGTRSESVRNGESERGVKAWREDESGRGQALRGKRWGRNWWGVRQSLFEGEEERKRSGVKSEVVKFKWEGRVAEEEYLVDSLRGVYGSDG